jgi:hypothetical protein
MRYFLLFLVLLSFCFSAYQSPPVNSVTLYNVLKADELSDSFNESIAENDSIHLRWYGKNLAINASMRIAGLTLIVDNSTTAGENVRVIIEEGGRMDHLIQKGSTSLRCDDDFYPECDFDGDGCAEYEVSTDIFYTIEINFTFRNVSEVVRADETNENILGVLFKKAITNKVSIPDNIEETMADSSGDENLTVVFNGTATFVYAIDNRSSGGTHCISNKGVVYKTLYFSDNKTYPVQGRNQLLFTVAPVLNEQWFRNNHFDNMVLSQNRIYKAEIYRDDEKQVNFTLYEFNITEDSFGLQSIESMVINDSEYVGKTNATPVYLDNETHTYSFLYLFDYSYEGMGENELELVVYDFFGGNKSIKQRIFSKQLSYEGSKTETGEVYDPETTRKSAKFGMDEIRLLEIGVGMVGIVVIILLIYRIRG